MPQVDIQVAVKRIQEPKEGHNGYTGFHPGKVEIFKAGSKPFGDDTKALTQDVQLDVPACSLDRVPDCEPVVASLEIELALSVGGSVGVAKL